MKYLIFASVVLLAACGAVTSPEVSINQKAADLLKVWATENLKEEDSTLTIDSLAILYIDTITQKEDYSMQIRRKLNLLTHANKMTEIQIGVLKLEKARYENMQTLSELSGSYSGMKLFKSAFDDQKEKTDKSLAEARKLGAECDSMLTVIAGNSLDSITPMYYQAVFTMCYSNKKMEQECRDSLTMNFTKDFRARK